ncbi:hypothetical protein AMELA_G00261060 [Ameiurus melas]|uniref:Uncharacterized protein n=1 Tax=Ameiurus melas TaxID=219545 RepID=A0A7J5ZNP0_AMEME|nr:hypothetical protein AMELA_G00261060 [Ameiurus melas]
MPYRTHNKVRFSQHKLSSSDSANWKALRGSIIFTACDAAQQVADLTERSSAVTGAAERRRETRRLLIVQPSKTKLRTGQAFPCRRS